MLYFPFYCFFYHLQHHGQILRGLFFVGEVFFDNPCQQDSCQRFCVVTDKESLELRVIATPGNDFRFLNDLLGQLQKIPIEELLQALSAKRVIGAVDQELVPLYIVHDIGNRIGVIVG